MKYDFELRKVYLFELFRSVRLVLLLFDCLKEVIFDEVLFMADERIKFFIDEAFYCKSKIL